MPTTAGGPVSSSPGNDKREALKCSVCLDIFREPKLLPCSHTFCLACLKGLTAGRRTATFPCPQCRSPVAIPPGGVAAFQSNFYISAEDLAAAREGTRCLTHAGQELDLFCADCRLAVCLKCVLTKHKQHATQDLLEAAREGKGQLSQNQTRLGREATWVSMALRAEERERQALQDKRAALRTAVWDKHAALVAMADKYRDEALASLDAACGEMEREVTAGIDAMTGSLQELRQLEEKAKEALCGGTALSQVTVGREAQDRVGRLRVVRSLRPAERSTVSRPVLDCTCPLDDMKQKVRDFFGTVTTLKMEAWSLDDTVEEKFTCGNGQDTEVFSLCPLDDGSVWVSYANRGLESDAASEWFEENGARRDTKFTARGKCSWINRGNAESIFVEASGGIVCTFPKRKYDGGCLELGNNGLGRADIKKLRVIREVSLKTRYCAGFPINVGPHRAHDVSQDGQLFAVVEEPGKRDPQPRKVKLYERNRADPVATYSSPSAPFNPSDLCFFPMGGEEVLMIANETGDSIQIASVTAGKELSFVRHVAPGSPLIVQPTALGRDGRERLWVACRGGRVLTVTPSSPPVF